MDLYNHAVKTFASDSAGVLEETACAAEKDCNSDQTNFLAILSRALANAEALAPSLQYSIGLSDFIDKSANGAAGQCSGGKNGTTCGMNWSTAKWDGTQGLGQDLSALEIILATLPSSGVRSHNSTGTTGNTGGSQTSSGASSTPTNGARRQGASLAVLAVTIMLACFAAA